MNALHNSYNNFSVLAFPCNQFGQQEPGIGAAELLNGIRYVRPGNNFVPAFPMFKKIDVNGKRELSLFTFLKLVCPSTTNKFFDKSQLFYDPLVNSDIRWNYEKFLVTKSGKPFKRYDPGTNPKDIKFDVEYLLSLNN